MNQVVRRRDGVLHRLGKAAPLPPPEPAAVPLTKLSPLERLIFGRNQLAKGLNQSFPLLYQPREEQFEICVAFVHSLTSAIERLSGTTHERPNTFMRVIAPPRIGKTYVMVALAVLSGASVLVLGPTLNLVDQLRSDFLKQFPGLHTGIYTGEEKDFKPDGLTFATYAIIHKQWHNGVLPEALRNVTFVFADEAHKAMSTKRMNMFHGAFPKETIRVAFTATEEYDEQKSLKLLFPHLVREVTLDEALALGRLADGNAHLYEVDIDGSEIELLGGDYSPEQLSQVMEQLPILEAVRVLRYEMEGSAPLSATVPCRTQEQALAVHRYLNKHRPAGSPPVEVLLDSTPTEERRRIRQAFDAGTVDTIVQVRLLLEGWNAPRLKLLIDVAPSTSLVLSKQKYFRPLTPLDGQVATIYVVLPRDLSRLPVLPGDVMGTAVQYKSLPDFWLDDYRRPSAPKVKARAVRTEEIASRVETRNVMLAAQKHRHARLRGQKPLSMENIDVLREILAPAFPDPENDVLSLGKLTNTQFDGPFFTGWGSRLLRMLRVKSTPRAYARFLYQVFPGPAAYEYAQRYGVIIVDAPTAYDVAIALRLYKAGQREKYWRQEEFQSYYETVVNDGQTEPLDETVIRRQELVRFERAWNNVLSERQRFVLDWRQEHTLSETGKAMGLSRERVRGIEREARIRLRDQGGIRDLRGEKLPEPSSLDDET